MAEIFISYASENRERARGRAEAFGARGWSVWWDREIPLGKSFDQVIEKALGEAGKKSASQVDLRQAIFKLRPGKTQYSYRRGGDTKTVAIECPNCKAE